MGRFLVLAGILLVIIGFILHYSVEIPGVTSWLGLLPGDIVIRKKDVTIYLPLATSCLISFLVSLCLSLFRSKAARRW